MNFQSKNFVSVLYAKYGDYGKYFVQRYTLQYIYFSMNSYTHTVRRQAIYNEILQKQNTISIIYNK